MTVVKRFLWQVLHKPYSVLLKQWHTLYVTGWVYTHSYACEFMHNIHTQGLKIYMSMSCHAFLLVINVPFHLLYMHIKKVIKFFTCGKETFKFHTHFFWVVSCYHCIIKSQLYMQNYTKCFWRWFIEAKQIQLNWADYSMKELVNTYNQSFQCEDIHIT